MRSVSSWLTRATKFLVIAVFLSAVSSRVPGKVIDVVPGSEDCQAGCLAAAAGWPVPYIVDGHGLSPGGAADLVGVLLGLDRLDSARALLNILLWLGVIAAIRIALAWRHRSR